MHLSLLQLRLGRLPWVSSLVQPLVRVLPLALLSQPNNQQQQQLWPLSTQQMRLQEAELLYSLRLTLLATHLHLELLLLH
jgi:hypothetical protein